MAGYGGRALSLRSRLRLKTVGVLSIGFLLFNVLLVVTVLSAVPLAVKVLAGVVLAAFNVPIFLSFIHLLIQTRKLVREAYGIPEGRCEGLDDILVSVWCPPCSLAQMGRHTGEYETYRALCCSETGLPNHVAMVPAFAYNAPPPPSIG